MTIQKEALVSVFVDVENVPGWLAEDGMSRLMDTLARDYSTVVLRRAYGNWASNQLSSCQRPLNRWGFELVHVYHPVSGKNSADIQIVVDAMETLDRRPDLMVYVLVTGDSDFSPLFRRLRERGKIVVGVGPESPLSDSVQSSCDRFIFTNRRRSSPPTPSPGRTVSQTVSSADLQVVATVDHAIPAAGSPIRVNRLVETLLRLDPAFRERVPGPFLRFLRTNPGAWRVFENPAASNVWWVEQKAGAHSVDAPNEPAPAVEASIELYATFLRQKSWGFSDRDSLLTVYEILVEKAAGVPLTAEEALERVLAECEEQTPEADVKAAIRALVAVPATDGEFIEGARRHTVRVGLSADSILDGYDSGAMARLLTACDERKVPFKIMVAREFCVGERSQSRVDRILALAKARNQARRAEVEDPSRE